MPYHIEEPSFLESLFSNPIIVVGMFLLLIIIAIFVALNIWKYFARKGFNLPLEFRKVILMVSVPKESVGGKTDSEDGSNASKIQEQISWAENLWASLGGLKAQKGFKAWLYGRFDELSLEIVAQNKMIYFYVVVPQYLQQFIEQQIQAQYPHSQIEQVEDYNIFVPHGKTSVAYLKLVKSDVFPFKTFRKMEADPLSALTNSLSKLGEGEGAVIQLIIRPANKNWSNKARKVVEQVMSGKKMSEAVGGSGDKAWYDKVAKGAIKSVGGVASALKTEDNEKPDLPNQQQLSAMDQEVLKSIEEKASKAVVEVNLRVVVSSSNEILVKTNLDNILNSFSQYNIYEYGNSFKAVKMADNSKMMNAFIHRICLKGTSCVLNTEELASLFHFPLPSCSTPNIHWLGARKAPAPVNTPEQGLILGENIYRGKETIVRIKKEDRRRHIYIIGMTGTGKSKLMVNMIMQDIQNGEGVCYIDPHGEEVEDIASAIPKHRIKDVIYFDPADTERPVGLNMLEAKTNEQKDFATQEMIQIFYKLVTDPAMLGPMFEHYMRNAMLLLMADKENPSTIVEIPRVFVDEEFRKVKLDKCDDILVKAFWEKEYTASQRGSTGADMLSYVISKVGRFIENEMMRNIIGQPHSGFDIRKIMDEKKILLVNLSKGKVGEVNSNLLGLILVSKLQIAAMGRADIPQEQRNDFYLYIDEFQNYVTDSIAVILAEARKYRLNLNMAHQYISQLVKNNDASVREAVFGNAGTMISFRVGVEDTETLAKQFAPVFNEFDLMNIEKYNAYVRLLVDNEAVRPFNMRAFPPVKGSLEIAEVVRDYSSQTYGRPKDVVEQEILERSKLGQQEEVETKDKMDMR
ncbi:type IV secretion system DNA-binding domain-containing protein [Candidatus Parcubacteria bacterium]|nr:type IV secretion system DNA-binding domain-containing protein [Patescibacteria group bacterium]MBU4481832.1 type IV secretion system DNA-binding domain-containing protein [Patescibacteria group bacterium]MCG2686904.1 type IV secretion system DNA-binding domain-containing protein [Candidatus Parcubacteria bacterium]